jgi:Flp pilus assembly protein CpaB
MKNTSLAMVAALVAVAMLSAVLAVAPMQQVSASNDGGDSTGDNKVKIKQSNECKKVIVACGNLLFGEIDQNTGID